MPLHAWAEIEGDDAAVIADFPVFGEVRLGRAVRSEARQSTEDQRREVAVDFAGVGEERVGATWHADDCLDITCVFVVVAGEGVVDPEDDTAEHDDTAEKDCKQWPA